MFLRSLAFEAVSLVYTDSFVLCCITGIVAESMVEKTTKGGILNVLMTASLLGH